MTAQQDQHLILFMSHITLGGKKKESKINLRTFVHLYDI